MARVDTLIRDSKPRGWLIVALVATVICTVIPFGQFVLYPFELFETFWHESFHAFAAIVTGGDVLGMNVNWDTSGLTRTAGGSRILVSSAGYLGTTLLGSALLLAGRKAERAQPTLLVLGAFTVVATLLFAGYGSRWMPVLGFGLGATLVAFGRAQKTSGRGGDKPIALGGLIVLGVVVYLTLTGGFLTWAVGLAVGLGLLVVGTWASDTIAQGTLMFVAVQTVLGAMEGLKVLFDITIGSDQHSDAINMAQTTGIPASLWALAWGVLGAAIVISALWIFWRDERRVDTART